MKKAVSQKQLREWLQVPGSHVHVIDIRSKDEFEKRHIPPSENVPAELFGEKSAAWDKNSIVVYVCDRS